MWGLESRSEQEWFEGQRLIEDLKEEREKRFQRRIKKWCKPRVKVPRNDALWDAVEAKMRIANIGSSLAKAR
jgi:hypothetical protein